MQKNVSNAGTNRNTGWEKNKKGANISSYHLTVEDIKRDSEATHYRTTVEVV